MNSSYLILSVLWISFCLIHSLLADLSFKKEAFKLLGRYDKYYRSIYSFISFAFLLFILWYQFKEEGSPLFQNNMLSRFIEFAFCITGILIILICSKKYLSFITGFSNKKINSSNGQLFTGGLNSIVRHPLYAGTLIFIWALFFLFPFANNLICCTIITLYVFIGIRLEEQKLIIKYGAAYKAYAQKVPMIIPVTIRSKIKSAE